MNVKSKEVTIERRRSDVETRRTVDEIDKFIGKNKSRDCNGKIIYSPYSKQ